MLRLLEMRRRGGRRGYTAGTGPKEEHKVFDVEFYDIARTGFDLFLRSDALRKELIKINDDITLYEEPPRVTSAALEKGLSELKARVLALNEVKDDAEMKDADAKEKAPESKGKESESNSNEKGKEKEADTLAVRREALAELTTFVETQFSVQIEQAENVTKAKKINFDNLGFLFRKKDQIYTTDEGGKWAGEVISTQFQESHQRRIFIIAVNTIDTDGTGFHIIQKYVYIHEFDGIKEFSALPAWRLDDETKEKLTERGKLYMKFGLGKHYLYYKGTIFRKDRWRTVKYRADGRMMVDCGNFQRFNPNYPIYVDSGSGDPGMTTLEEEQLYMCAPTVRGFSFYAKKWGEIHLENLSPIVFNDQAFDQLVLDEGRKRLIKALVRHNEETFSDIISGKGGACIFLLHGPPGVGKTLTAEAVAELLHRPLYSITTGELGVDAPKLEHNLQEILETSRAWNSITLIDEADIFLEKRADNDIARNALVGVFLRLLEYHQGILILTTNRVACFDEAFYSRITLSLSYQKLDDLARKEIWHTLCRAAKITDLNLDELARYDLNGRQIKNVIKVAQALAFEETKSQPGMAHIKLAIQSSLEFSEDLERKKRKIETS
eukprot:Phypoly_transcript_04409.p1 GENE.Phypoly_transcript_04409~~Phypoly_transcript_04409.p1  ORF type:complete len:609 (+),score=119.31 Phypoly_transcript_04409:301-2127(+)